MNKSKALYICIASLFFTIMLIVTNICYYKVGKNFALSILVISIAIAIFIMYIKSDILNPISIYTIFWLGSVGLSCYKLSSDQQEWTGYVWVVIINSYLMFCLGYFITRFRKVAKNMKNKQIIVDTNKVYTSIIFCTLLALSMFLLEVFILKFIPLFSGNMDSYKKFHISGIHYFVTSVAIIPMLTVYYKSINGKRKIWLINLISFSISILIVSRQLLIMQIILVIISYNYLIKQITLRKILVFSIISLVLFSLSFNIRNQSIDYFKEATNVKIESESFLIQPFIYFTSNFENLRNIIENFSQYKYGKTIIYPILALTNTKDIIDYSYRKAYLTNRNLTTYTYLGDIYYDFGFIGTTFIPLILGMIYSIMYGKLNKSRNCFTNNIYFLLVYCLIFCFFVNWYINPTIVFYLVMLLILNKYCTRIVNDK